MSDMSRIINIVIAVDEVGSAARLQCWGNSKIFGVPIQFHSAINIGLEIHSKVPLQKKDWQSGTVSNPLLSIHEIKRIKLVALC